MFSILLPNIEGVLEQQLKAYVFWKNINDVKIGVEYFIGGNEAGEPSTNKTGLDQVRECGGKYAHSVEQYTAYKEEDHDPTIATLEKSTCNPSTEVVLQRRVIGSSEPMSNPGFHHSWVITWVCSPV